MAGLKSSTKPRFKRSLVRAEGAKAFWHDKHRNWTEQVAEILSDERGVESASPADVFAFRSRIVFPLGEKWTATLRGDGGHPFG
jgi:hypothetical protein